MYEALYKDKDFYTKKEPIESTEILSVTQGLTESQIKQLIGYSNDDEVVGAYSSDPRRFKDREAFDKWLSKGRSIYALNDKDGSLLGIVWFGKAAFPDNKLRKEFENIDKDYYSITFALRMYEGARGKGLAKKLTASAFTAYLRSDDYKQAGGQGIWLETSQENTAAVKTYETLFTQVSDPDEHGRIVMILDPAATSQKHSEL